jgi:hypothetical protein
MARCDHPCRRHSVLSRQADPAAQIIAGSGGNEAQDGPAALGKVRSGRGVDPQMHHAVATHNGQNVDAILDRSVRHRPRLGEIPAQQDLQIAATIA